MICRQCLRAAARIQLQPSTSSTRLFTTTPLRFLTSDPSSPAQSPEAYPPLNVTSTAAAQPFSTPLTPADPAPPPPKKSKTVVVSSVPAGTPLRGLNFIRDRPDPVALADSEYPDWLWEVLREKKKKDEGAGGVDMYAKSKKQRRLAAKQARREALLNPEKFAPKVPLVEQSVDLPVGDGSVEGAVDAARARAELTKAMRDKRRAGIKEMNYLKSMR